MLGLKCAGAFPGWTRLCDEWLIGLDASFTMDGTTPWESREATLRTLTAAAVRTRRFARGGDTVDPIEPDAQGIVRFELQGIDYVIATSQWTPAGSDDLVAGAESRLAEVLPGARAAAKGEDHPVALLFVTPNISPTEDPARTALVDGWIDAFRSAQLTHAMAYAFPRDARRASSRYATEARPGALLLARSGSLAG